MKKTYILAAAAAALAGAGCDQKADTTSNAPVDVTPVAPPAGQQWSDVVTQTAQGGFLVGNPNAAVKVVEFASMTCPHCAEFDHAGMQPLLEKYVKTGQVSLELRNFVRDPYDLTATLIARCGGAQRFIPLTRELFEDQKEWTGQLSAVPAERLQALQSLPPTQQFLEIAKLSGLQQWAAQRGLPTAASTQCLTNQAEIDRLVQMNADAISDHNVPGTPSFLINGELAEASTWQALEPKIRDALS